MTLDYMSNDPIVVNNELKRLWNEAVSLNEVLFHNLPRGMVEEHKNDQSELVASQPKF